MLMQYCEIVCNMLMMLHDKAKMRELKGETIKCNYPTELVCERNGHQMAVQLNLCIVVTV